MRLLVLSDLHASATALAAALTAAAGRWDRAVCLGDLVGYGPDPNEVIDQVRDLTATVIRGNHDKAACGITDLEDFNPVAGMALAWTRNQLSKGNVAYLRGLPAGPVEMDGLVLVHGSVRDEDEYIFSPEEAEPSFLDARGNVTFFGHTHYQGGFAYRDGEVQVIHLRIPPGMRGGAAGGTPEGANYAALNLESGARYLINPGSVGQPRDGDRRAAFAIIDRERGVVEFWRVPYDIGAVQKRMTQVNAPEALVTRLAWGR